MMSQENYVNINDLHKQGWTIIEIAEATGWHRTTVSNYLKNGPPPATRATEATVMTEHWQRPHQVDARVVAEVAVGEHPQQARRDRLRRFVSDRRARGSRHSWPSVPGSGCGVGADPHRPGRGSPVRLLRPVVDWAASVRLEDQPGVFRDDLVVVAVSDVVVHHVGGSASHLRRHRPLLRPDRWCSDGVSHRSDGSTRPIPGQTLRAASTDGRLRRASLDEDHLVSGRRRETQGQGRAAVPVAARDVPARRSSSTASRSISTT